jgi:predicted metal-binding membrane protein
MRLPASHPRLFLGLWAAVFALAWVILWVWQHSAWGRYLDHGDWTQAGIAQSLCASLPAGNWPLPLLLYAGGWLLMSAAMMLPTALPLMHRFRAMTRPRTDAMRLMALLVTGYLVVWSGFGVLAHLLDIAVHWGAARVDWLVFNGWAIGAGVIALAGLFQFSRLKDFCLERCRAPMGFVLRRWHGPRPSLAALAIGLDHGLYCVGCCWAQMLLMFVTGTASVGWMLLLGLVMAAEKTLPGGDRLALPLGPCCLVWPRRSRAPISCSHCHRSKAEGAEQLFAPRSV